MYFNLATFQTQIQEKSLKEILPLFRIFLKGSQNTFREAFQKGDPILKLLQARAKLIDFVLKKTWDMQQLSFLSNFAVVAVGGYGRYQLHPGSDIDVLIVFSQSKDKKLAIEFVSNWLTTLWDIGLEIGHSVRTLQECIDESVKDVTVVTNLMEARFLFGDKTLFDKMKAQTASPTIWPCEVYFEAKYQEQLKRHKKYHDTAYNLEPNIKGTPGGLRDIQTIEWIAIRHFGSSLWEDWVEQGFLLDSEYKALERARDFLWRVRFALHVLAGRREDRLLFDYQRQVATLLRYQDTPNHLAVERLMKEYYQAVMEVQTLNELLMQVFKEQYAGETKKQKQFVSQPENVFKLLIALARHSKILELSSNIRRLLRKTGKTFKPYSDQPVKVKQLFLALLKEVRGEALALRIMKQHGILGAYLPELARVTGQMQYDLFHIYTVDEHTLFVIKRICDFYNDKYKEHFPLCNKFAKKIKKPELLIIAALFHDLAKGRGGDHSELGAFDAERFCIAHNLSSADTSLVVWLVQNHLLLSMTAQKRDLSDPQVIENFTEKVQDQIHLNYLYLLTCADISATNPQLWNAWRASLVRELFETATLFLQKKQEGAIRFRKSTEETKNKAETLLRESGISEVAADKIWIHWDDEFFLRLSPEDIAWQTEAIYKHQKQDEPLVLVRNSPSKGATEIFVYCQDRDYLFATITNVLAGLDLSIVDAQIMGDDADHLLDTFFVLESFGTPVLQEERQIEIKEALLAQLRFNDRCLLHSSRAPSRLIRHFTWPTQVHFEEDKDHKRTILELTALDKPGLLAKVGQVFFDCGIILHRAKIATVGEKAEDVFYVTAQNRKVLSKTLKQKLKQKLIAALD